MSKTLAIVLLALSSTLALAEPQKADPSKKVTLTVSDVDALMALAATQAQAKAAVDIAQERAKDAIKKYQSQIGNDDKDKPPH